MSYGTNKGERYSSMFRWLLSHIPRRVWSSRRAVIKLVVCGFLSQVLFTAIIAGRQASNRGSELRFSNDDVEERGANRHIAQRRLPSKFTHKPNAEPNLPPPDAARDNPRRAGSTLRFHRAKAHVEAASRLGFRPLAADVGANVSTFVYFIGPIRSSHSIVGSFIDAHPHALVADEFNVFGQMQSNPTLFSTKADVAEAMWEGSWLAVNGGTRDETFKGYDLKLPQLFNGAFNHSIQLVGDKIGFLTNEAFAKDRRIFERNLGILEGWFKVKAIMVVRNPFDNVATLTMYNHITDVLKVSKRGTNHITLMKSVNSCVNSSAALLHSPAVLRQAVETYSRWTALSAQMIAHLSPDIAILPVPDLIAAPGPTMRRLCAFLGLHCTDGFIAAIEQKTFNTDSKSRHNIKWTREAYNKVDALLDKYPQFFKGMSFFD